MTAADKPYPSPPPVIGPSTYKQKYIRLYAPPPPPPVEAPFSMRWKEHDLSWRFEA